MSWKQLQLLQHVVPLLVVEQAQLVDISLEAKVAQLSIVLRESKAFEKVLEGFFSSRRSARGILC